MPRLPRRTFTGALLAGSLAPALALAARETRPRDAPSSNAATAPGVAALPVSETLLLWPGVAPGLPNPAPVEQLIERSTQSEIHDRALTGVTQPRMAVFRPAKANGAAVLIFPGGGYRLVVVDKEGFELGAWFAARGYTAFVLFYRLPGDGWAAGADIALSDAQRAMRVIQRDAARFGFDPQRVAAMGFSAGGHVCADLATRFDARTYEPVDAADELSARPLCIATIYPVVTMSAPYAHAGSRHRLLGAAPSTAAEAAHSAQLNVRSDTPPAFLLHAADDDVVPVENTLLLHAALRAKGVESELHVFAHGGHGFGLRRAAGKPVAVWPELFEAWARTRNWVNA